MLGRAGTVPPNADKGTVAYFDHYAPKYRGRRLHKAVELINERKPADASLIDVGCGVGSGLAFLTEQTGIRNVVGLDVSAACLARTHEVVGAELHQASILDAPTVRRFEGQFDFAVMAAVLHHLVARTRRASANAASLAVANAFQLVRPGGCLVIIEPTFTPSAPLTALFWVKKATSSVVPYRVPIGSYWNNIGPPVVSYYSERQVLDMVECQPRAQVVSFEAVPRRQSRLAGAVLSRTETTVMVERRP